jgi:hypothetical protein
MGPIQEFHMKLLRATERPAYGFYDYRAFWGTKERDPWGDASWWLQVCCGLEGPTCRVEFD